MEIQLKLFIQFLNLFKINFRMIKSVYVFLFVSLNLSKNRIQALDSLFFYQELITFIVSYNRITVSNYTIPAVTFSSLTFTLSSWTVTLSSMTFTSSYRTFTSSSRTFTLSFRSVTLS